MFSASWYPEWIIALKSGKQAFERINNAKITGEQILDLSGQLLDEIPKEIKNLKYLKSLDISGNTISEFPSWIFELKTLETLNISAVTLVMKHTLDENEGYYDTGNGLISLIPSEISQLTNLVSFTLTNNRIKSLPKSLNHLNCLQRLDLRGNPLPIPPEILEKIDEPQTILNYYFSLNNTLGVDNAFIETKAESVKAMAGKQLNELKLLFVGQGSVGKTSLVQQILHGTFDQSQTKTEGISINQWKMDGGQKTESDSTSSSVHGQSSIKLNIWDFGGQEIMRATHQFFLTKRSLYLLVLDARLTQEENRVEYWLKIIQSFGGESPVLLVGNKTDQHPLDIDRTGLQKKYTNIVSILETSAATGAGIEALKAEIAKQVDTLPHVRDLLPETWFTVKSKLEELGRDKNFITQDEYLDLCGANDVADETSQHTLIGFLHDLGVVLHFQDDPRLEALGILNPQWVTNGVYKIINSHELFQNQGTLTLPILNKTLIPPEYSSNKRLFIVDMMKKFELCYDIEPDKSFLIPDLLPKDEIYTGEWDDALAFQYHYNVLPSSIITRFIVRMNAFIHKNTIWRTGAVLKRDDNTALVKADIEDKKIYIYVGGKQDTRRELLAMIRGGFDAIHKTIAKIEVTEKVPLPNAPEAAPVDLTFLQRAASEGRESLPVQVGDKIVDLVVEKLLSQVEKEGSRVELHIHGNVDSSNIIIGNDNKASIVNKSFTKIYRKIEKSSRTDAEKKKLTTKVNDIEQEVAKGDNANESFLSRRLRNLKKMAPDIADVIITALASPTATFGIVVQKIAEKIRDEAKNTS